MLLLLLLWHCGLINACGISVHNEITYRSLEFYQPINTVQSTYKDILVDSASYVQAGSFFPDWGYQCLGYHQPSEDAHWAPFIKAAIEYIREEYPRPWTQPHVQGLIAFIFATMSHDVADVKWHSLGGLVDYFIQAMAHIDFQGDSNEAHTAADTGAEFTLRHSSRLSYLNETWQVPTRDIVNIYARLYAGQDQKVLTLVPSEDHLKYCMAAGFAASRVDLKFGRLMFGYYGSKSPFLVDQLNNYHKGGLQDLAVSVTECFDDIINAFEHGVEARDVLCATYFDDSASAATNKNVTQTLTPGSHVEEYLQKHVFTEYDLTHGVLKISTDEAHNGATERSEDRDTTASSAWPFAWQEQTYTDYQLVNQHEKSFSSWWAHVDEPLTQQCRWLAREIIADGAPPSTVTLSLSVPFAGIGHATATGDYDGDGQPDLAISAPYHPGKVDTSLQANTDRMLMAGRVFILNGTSTLLAEAGHDPLAINDIGKVSQTILKGDQTHGRFGWSMATVDLNRDGIDDLAVAAPFSDRLTGHVDVYLGRANGKGLSPEPSFRIRLQHLAGPTEGFGSYLVGLDVDQDGYKDLVVGCPYCSVMNQAQAGSVFVILSHNRYDEHHPNVITQPDWILASSDVSSYEHFGSAIEWLPSAKHGVSGLLVIGAPGHGVGDVQQVGRVYGFEVHTPIQPRLLWTLTGSRRFEQYGRVLLAGKTNLAKPYLAIASPFEETQVGLQRHWQGGGVRVYDVGSLAAIEKSIDLKMEHGMVARLRGRRTAGHLGATLSFYEEGGDVGLWVGEPMADHEKGRVHQWLFTRGELECLENRPMLARFGSQIGPVGSDAICITSQHFSHEARFSGAVHLIQTA